MLVLSISFPTIRCHKVATAWRELPCGRELPLRGVNCHCVALISTPIGAELIAKIKDFGVMESLDEFQSFALNEFPP